MSEDCHMALRVDHVDGEPVACFHQGVQVCSAGMDSYPPGVVAG